MLIGRDQRCPGRQRKMQVEPVVQRRAGRAHAEGRWIAETLPLLFIALLQARSSGVL